MKNWISVFAIVCIASVVFATKTSDGAKGYKIYWRDTTSPTWDHFKYIENSTEFTLEGIVVDNFFFGIAAVGENGHESIVSFPSGLIKK